MKPFVRILVFILLCVSINTWAQKDSVKLKPLKYVSLNIGTSGPESNFIQSSSISEPQTGLMLNCNIHYPLCKNWIGAEAKLLYSENGFGGINNYLPGSNSTPYYYSGWGLAGLCLSIPVKHIYFTVRFLAGAMYLNSPEIDTHYSEYSPGGWGYTDTTYIKHKETIAFAYDIGIGITCSPNDRFSVLFNVDFYSANRNNSVEIIDFGYQSSPPPSFTSSKWYNVTQYSVGVSLLSFSIGVAYNLTR
jgi:hypothetical protein